MGFLKKQHKGIIQANEALKQEKEQESEKKRKEFTAEYNDLCEKYHLKIVAQPMMIAQIKIVELTEEEIKRAYEKAPFNKEIK